MNSYLTFSLQIFFVHFHNQKEDVIEEEDFDDAYWLIPGIVPEPCWDINMGQEFNFAQLKFYLNKALRVPLSQKEVEHI